GLLRVELVIADPRGDQGALPAHRLLALLEPPALPAVAARLGPERALEASGENRLGDVDRDPAKGVDDLVEGAEVDHDNVVDRKASDALHGLDGERRAPVGEGRVDLVLAVARDVHAQVARDGEERDAVL